MFKFRAALVGLLTATAFAIFLASGANASSTGTLSCTLTGGGTPSIGANGDYTLSPGDTVNCTITGAKSQTGSSVNIYVKHGGSATSSSYQMSGGNEVVPGTYSGGTITFSYSTVGLSTCNTAALSYGNTMGAMKNSKGASSTFTYGDGFSCDSSSPPPAASPLMARATGGAGYTRTYTWGVSKNVDQSSASYTIGQDAVPTFNYTVTVTHDGGTDGGWGASGTITASNPNTADVPNVSASIGDSNCTVANGSQTVSADSSATWNYNCSYSSAGPSSLSMTISWPGETLSDGSVLAAGSASASASLDWSNPTNVVDGSVSVSDNVGSLGTVSATDSSPTAISYPLQLSGTAGQCSDFTNTATINGSTNGNLDSSSQTVNVCAFNPPSVDSISATDPGTESFTRTYGWNVTKGADSSSQNIPAGGSATFHYTVQVSHDNGTDSGWYVTGQIVADNPNSVEVDGLTASIGDSNCSVSNNPQNAPSGGSATFDYSCSFSSTPPNSLALSVSWGTQTLSDGGTLDGGTASATQPLDWSHPTTVVNGSVEASDSQQGDLGTVSASDASPTSFSYDKTFSGVAGICTSYPNVASISSTDGLSDSANASVQVCVGSDLTASATSTTSFTRTYAWGIAKKVNGSALIEKSGGGTGTFSYTVTATHDAGTDSAWQTAGTITLTNPNHWESINANVSDTIDNGGTCVVDNGGAVTLAAGQTTTIGYTCSYSSAPTSSTGNDTVTVSWNGAAASTPDNSTTATSIGTFGAPTTRVNGSTSVSDSLKGSLGLLTYSSPATTSYTYSLSFAIPTSNCRTYPNTASLSVNGSSAGASVEVCGPANTGALSMGYWSNKNGIAFITGGASTGTVCNSGTWLRQYAAFQDLSATATCAQVNTYVQGIIKTASAAGPTMNAMLKAQMLATALDVYFSDATLGGNKIGAPAPIGSVSVDLAHVGASLENCTGGFGGSSSLTILQMLSYASSQSNVGGANWYGQNKVTQGLAKDAFDAIDNSLVFSP